MGNKHFLSRGLVLYEVGIDIILNHEDFDPQDRFFAQFLYFLCD